MALQLYVWHCPDGRGTQAGTVSGGATLKDIPNCNAGKGSYQLVEVSSLSQPYQPDIEAMVFASAGVLVMWGLGIALGIIVTIVKKART